MRVCTKRLKPSAILPLISDINIPTGKDSLSMTQKYPEEVVYAPGTVIISAVGEVSDIRKTVSPVIEPHRRL